MRDDKKNSDFLKQLNTQQKEAVETIEGPVIVLAGPGTGKTQVLTARIANILLKTDTKPSSILALTFTDSAVREMKERLVSIIGTEAYAVNIHTFHSFSSDIIKSNPVEFLISSKLEPLSDLERIHIFKKIFDASNLIQLRPFNAPYFYLKTAMSKIKELKREGIDPQELEAMLQNDAGGLEEKDIQKNHELAKIYKAYQEKLKEYGRYDFEDMINFVISKFKADKDFLRKHQELYQYILVDEFQDTNSAQAELLYLLCEYWDHNPNLFVVGDDDQSIYRFQGASLENILTFINKYPDSKKLALTQNYRSNAELIRTAESLIEKNEFRINTKFKIDKRQTSAGSSFESAGKEAPENTKPLYLGEFSSGPSENYFIAKKIQELIATKVEPKNIAVIYRNNSDSFDIADMLWRMGIQYELEGGEDVLYSGVIIRLLHLLKVVYKIRFKEEDETLFTLLNYEFLNLDPLDILKLSRFATEKKINLFDALIHKEIITAKILNLLKLKEILSKIIQWNKDASNLTAIELIDKVIDQSGYLNWIINCANSYELLNKLNSFLSEIKRLSYSEKNLTLEGLLQYLDLMTENGISINEEDLDIETSAVKLTTAHKSKGREYEYVFIAKFIDKKWSNVVNREFIKLPANLVTEVSTIQTEDERRLFFVALTRAKKAVYVTSAKNYRTSQKAALPAMFARELDGKFIEKINVNFYEKNAIDILKALVQPPKILNSSSPAEDAFIKSVLQNFKLSATSLNLYLECAYKFKLDLLFKTPRPREKALILGTCVHSALEAYHKEIKNGLGSNSSPKAVGLEFLLNSFVSSLDKESVSNDLKEDIKSQGQLILTTYYNKYEHELASSARNILFLEKFIGWGFSKPALDGYIFLQGKIDKIERSGDKSVKIVDYKTGRPKTRNQILGKTADSDGDQYRQLLFYRLLLDLDGTFDYKVDAIELDYIGDRNTPPKKEIFAVKDEELMELKKIIREVYGGIQKLEFQRTTNYSFCEKCKFKDHCWPDGVPVKFEAQPRLIT